MEDAQLIALRARVATDMSRLKEIDSLAADYVGLKAENKKLRDQIASQPVAPPPAPTPAPASKWTFGAYLPDLPEGRTALPALETRLDTTLSIASAFTDWSYVFGGECDVWMSAGGTRKVLYSWEPFGIRFSDITKHEQDSYLQRVADGMKKYPYTIYVRPWGEMNANWSSWQPTATGNKPDGGTPAEFIAAWRYVVNFFRSRGVTNLKFVFDPDASDYSDNTPIPIIWPGADYVDVLGIDGYNWGANTATGDTWREFDAIFSNMYGILTGLHPTAPVWICEVGCKEPTVSDGAPADAAHSKAVWLQNMFKMLDAGKFPRITNIAWFNVKKERDWRLESSTAAADSAKARLCLMK